MVLVHDAGGAEEGEAVVVTGAAVERQPAVARVVAGRRLARLEEAERDGEASERAADPVGEQRAEALPLPLRVHGDHAGGSHEQVVGRVALAVAGAHEHAADPRVRHELVAVVHEDPQMRLRTRPAPRARVARGEVGEGQREERRDPLVVGDVERALADDGEAGSHGSRVSAGHAGVRARPAARSRGPVARPARP